MVLYSGHLLVILVVQSSSVCRGYSIPSGASAASASRDWTCAVTSNMYCVRHTYQGSEELDSFGATLHH